MEGDQGHLQLELDDIYCYILHVVVEALDEAHTTARDLVDQGPTPS
jgi:hypothetical protein